MSTVDLVNISSYSTSLSIENDTGKVANEQVYFYANYTSTLMPVSGIGLQNYEIGQVIWNTTDLGGSERSAALFDCDNKGKKDCVAVGESTNLFIFYSNGTQKQQQTSPGGSIYEIKVGDFNNDNYWDGTECWWNLQDEIVGMISGPSNPLV